MVDSRFLTCVAVFTGLSLALGLASAYSAAVAGFGWAIGTAISFFGGAAYGLGGYPRGRALTGGAVVGGATIAIGCALAFALGALPLTGVIAATVVGVVTGALAGLGGSALR